jgi:hypothetical protein
MLSNDSSLLSNQLAETIRILEMPEKWDSYKDVIEKLYMKQGYTLENLREKMKVDHGFTAA